MKKLFGILLNIAGGLLALLGVVMILLQLSDWRRWGFGSSDLRLLLFILLAFGGVGIILCVLGVRLYQYAGKQEKEEMNPLYQREQTTFTQQEYQREKEKSEAGKADYVPGSGVYIWKYRGRKSSGIRFQLVTNGGILGMVFLAFLCIIGMVLFSHDLDAYAGIESSRWMQTGMIFILTALLGIGALYIGRKGNSMQLSFGRNEEGILYVFDYRSWAFQDYLKGRIHTGSGMSPVAQTLSVLAVLWNNVRVGKQIEQIDRERVLERIMKSGKIAPYGRKVISVKAIEQKKTYCQIYCSLRNVNGTIHDTRLIVSNSYEHFNELLYQFQQIQWNSAFDRKRSVSKYEKYKPLIRVLDVVLPVLCAIFLAGCIISRMYNENAAYEYETVTVRVVRCEGGAGSVAPNRKPTVTVDYMGTEYRLHNVVQGSWFYHTGETKEAYLADGKMYANVEGVTTTRTSGIIYFVFLFGFILLLTLLGMTKWTKKDIIIRSGEW